MPIKTSGPLPIQDIANEFGGEAIPNPLSDYFSDGVFVRGQYSPPTPRIPDKARGVGLTDKSAISVGTFYGKGRRKQFTVTISNNESNVNVYSKFKSLVQNEIVDVDCTLIINSGVTVSGSPALTVPANDSTRANGFKSTDFLTIINRGVIVGDNGLGGDGGCGIGGAGKAGTVGRDALILRRSTVIENTGTIAGGGSGGKGGNGGNVTSYNQRRIPATSRQCSPGGQQRSSYRTCMGGGCRGVGCRNPSCPCERRVMRGLRGTGRFSCGGDAQARRRAPDQCTGTNSPGAAQNGDVKSTNTCGGKGGDGASVFSNVKKNGLAGGGGGATAGADGGLWGVGGSYYLKGSNFLVGTLGGTIAGLVSTTP